MARGWESKSVEEQISAREAALQERARKPLVPDELQQRAKRESLLLARVRTLTALESAKDERYRTILRGALAHLDAQLAELL